MLGEGQEHFNFLFPSVYLIVTVSPGTVWGFFKEKTFLPAQSLAGIYLF